MYRILRENLQVTDRRRQARHPTKDRPELVAEAPRQVYTWDISKLAGPTKGVYFDDCVMVDIYFRYIVGVHVQTREPGLLAVENVVHADRGTSMTSKPVAARRSWTCPPKPGSTNPLPSTAPNPRRIRPPRNTRWTQSP